MNLFNWAENVIKDFNIFDLAIFKAYLFSLGLIAGAYFSDFIKKRIWFFVAIAVLTAAWIVYRILS